MIKLSLDSRFCNNENFAPSFQFAIVLGSSFSRHLLFESSAASYLVPPTVPWLAEIYARLRQPINSDIRFNFEMSNLKTDFFFSLFSDLFYLFKKVTMERI